MRSGAVEEGAWLKVLQGKRPPAEKWPRQSGAPKPGQRPATAQDSRPSPGCEGVRGPRSDCQVGSRDRSRWGRGRDGAQVEGGFEESPSTGADSPNRSSCEIVRTIFGQSPQECVEGARGSLQGTAVSDGSTEQARGVSGQGYRGRRKVDHVADRGRQPRRDHEGPHSGIRPSRLGGRVGRIATEGERIECRSRTQSTGNLANVEQ